MVIHQDKYTTLRICIFVGFTKLILSQVAPKLTPLPRELEFKRGERFQLVCSCREGEPPLTFNWVRNGQPLMETVEVSVRRFDEFSSSITISAVREDHTGNYTCIVSNLGGSDSSTVRLRVLVPPTWLRQPYDMSVLAGTRVTLNCETAGTPKPTITWRRNKGFNIQLMEPLGSNQWRTADDGSLTNSNIKKDDEGFYTCEVSNGVGDGLRKTVRIEVQVPPSVSVSEPVQIVRKGETVKLKCEVTGDSPLTISWSKANQHFPVANEERIEIEEENQAENTSSSVVVQSATAGDTGLYFCTARNSFGQSQAAIRLRVVEQPSAPLNFRVSEVWCKSVRLAWKQSYNGNSPLKTYIIKYKKKDATAKATEIKVPNSQTAVTIHDFRPSTTYEFQITAENVVGLSSPSQSLSVTTRVEEPEAAPTNVYVKSKDATGFLINWKAPPVQKWNGELLGFYIGYKRVSHGSAEATPFTYKRIIANKQIEDYEHYIGGLQGSSTYTAVVRAFNQAGIGPTSEQIIVKTSYGESPQVPIISLLHADQSLIRIKVESAGNQRASPNEYVLHIREGSSHWKKIPLISVKEEYTVAGLTPGGHYKLYITGRNKFGDSGPSDVLTLKMEQEDLSGSMFQYEEDIAVPFYQRLSFIIPVAVSLTTILVVPVAACCCLRKLGSLPAAKPEGVEARGFTYTAAAATTGECSTEVESRSLPPQPSITQPPSVATSQGHYSTLQNYGSVVPSNPRFSQIMEEVRRTSQVYIPPKQPVC